VRLALPARCASDGCPAHRWRCGLVLPDGFLFGEGVATRIKETLLQRCNLHTIVRLPNGVFAPYTGIKTNLLFLQKGKPTKEVWYFEHPYPPGVKSYNKTKPINIKEFDLEKSWWNNRIEIRIGNEKLLLLHAILAIRRESQRFRQSIIKNSRTAKLSNTNCSANFPNLPSDGTFICLATKVMALLSRFTPVIRCASAPELNQQSVASAAYATHRCRDRSMARFFSWLSLTAGFDQRQHAMQYIVAVHDMMLDGGGHVHRDKREHGVHEHFMQFFERVPELFVLGH
jgi:hypothetical protein